MTAPSDLAPRPDLGSLVDSHCHLTWESYGAEVDAVIAHMRRAGVVAAVVVATDGASSLRTRELCAPHAGLFPTAGIHPNAVSESWRAELSEIEAMLADPVYVAVGETGIDYYRDQVPPERQRASFAAHADLARRIDRPIIVHIRDRAGSVAAYDDVATILRDHEGVRGVIHCYTGDLAHADRYRACGMRISFSGIVTFPNAGAVREVAAATPLAETLIETDAPFLAPAPWRGQRNEPAYVGAVAAALAEVHGVPEADVRRATAANARRLFGLPDA